MSFDRLAPHYRWMELVLAGRKLQRCRTAFLPQAAGAHNILILGEGNGRFLAELLRANPRARVTCVDGSPKMLALARDRARRRGNDLSSVNFVHADILDWTPPEPQFDLVATHFFFDCFRADQLARIIPNVASAATPRAAWLLSDFREPLSPGPARWRARWILRSMYIFFRLATALPARQVSPPDPLLAQAGFQLQERRFSEWGLLHSDWWSREAAGGPTHGHCIEIVANTPCAV